MIEIINSTLVLEKKDLAHQRDPYIGSLTFRPGNNEILVREYGCAMISVYNLLKVLGYDKSFKDYLELLVTGNCLNDKGEINWLRFNTLNTGLRFVWMQDLEIPNCAPIDLSKLMDVFHLPKRFALVKVQSINDLRLRHFMVVLEVLQSYLVCLESSGKSGIIETRQIPVSDILGVRFFESEFFPR